MLKSELAHILAQKTHLPKAAVLEGLQELLAFMTQTLTASDTIEIRGFGRFSLKKHLNRRVRNPKTGEQMQMTEHRLPHFTPSKQLIRQLNSTRVVISS